MHSFIKRKYYIVCFFLFTFKAEAQCAMCRAVLESGEEQSIAEGINDGIVFLMMIPYLIVATIGYLVYKTYNNKSSKEV